MRVVRLRAAGGPEQLVVEDADRPRPGPADALVRVHAAAITRGELEWPIDRLPAIPSYELSGVVEEVGPGVSGVAPGDEVFALTPFDRDGVAASYTAVPAELLAPRPRALSHGESAAIPLPALTAWQGLFDHGRLGAGERVLIHGAAGSVGGFAVQLARAAGAHVIGTASADALGSVLELGAHEVVDSAKRFEDAVEPVHVVFDTVGGERLRRSLAVLTVGGRLVSVADEPQKEVCTSSSRPIATSSGRSRGWWMLASCVPRTSRSFRSIRRARRSRGAWSRTGGRRWCWRSRDRSGAVVRAQNPTRPRPRRRLLYVGAMFHDVGLLEGHRSEHERFEIDGANAARAFLERHGLPEEQVMTVWQSIALHTTRQVPDYLHPEVRLVALGVQYDVLGSPFDTLTADQRDAVVAAHPRTSFKRGMIEALAAGVRDKPETAIGTMLTDILEATVPGYVRPNVCDAIQNARFET